MTNEAPERIVAWANNNGSTQFEGGKLFPSGIEVKYIRADIHAAHIAELEAQRDRLLDALNAADKRLCSHGFDKEGHTRREIRAALVVAKETQ